MLGESSIKTRRLTGMSWHLNSPNFLFPQSQRKFLQGRGKKNAKMINQGESDYCQYTQQNFNNKPFGIQLKDIMSIVAFISTGETNPSMLCSTGSAGVAGKHSLPLNITLQQQTKNVFVNTAVFT